MNDLTHEQAHRFLQPGRQAHMDPAERQALEAHIAICEPCRRYAAESDALQARLRRALHARWDPVSGPASSYAPSVLAHTRRQTMVRNTFRLAGSLVLGILLIAALAGIINTFRLQPAGQSSGAPLPSETGTAPSLPESTPLLVIEPQPSVTPGLTRTEVITYTVQEGDTVYAIADLFDLTPETILWGNIETLGETPDVLMGGTILNILPVDGVYHRWNEGDTLEKVAAAYGVSPEAILGWPGNRLDPSDPVIETGTMLVIPGGQRPFTAVPSDPTSNGLIAFTLTRDDNTDIYVINPDGSGMRNLTYDPGADWGQAWSPDGTRLAFLSDRTGVVEVYVIHADGSGLAQLTHDTHPYYTHENESGVVDPNTPLYPSYDAPHWSPDGQTLTAVLRTGSPSEDSNFLALIKADGSDVSYIRGAFIDPQWSPDGALLAFMRGYVYDEEIWILDPATVQWDGTAQMAKVLEASDPNEFWGSLRWSPDGLRLVFSAIREEGNWYTRELRILERNGWTHNTLYAFEPFESEGGASSGDFAWSPDGSRLALVMPGPKDKPIANQIFLINTDGSGSVTLGVNLDFPFHLTWSPNGRYLLFEGGPLELGQDENGALRDENGNRWAIVNDNRAVWVLDVEAALRGKAVPARLTSETGRVSWPEWQPVP